MGVRVSQGQQKEEEGEEEKGRGKPSPYNEGWLSKGWLSLERERRGQRGQVAQFVIV